MSLIVDECLASAMRDYLKISRNAPIGPGPDSAVPWDDRLGDYLAAEDAAWDQLMAARTEREHGEFELPGVQSVALVP